MVSLAGNQMMWISMNPPAINKKGIYPHHGMNYLIVWLLPQGVWYLNYRNMGLKENRKKRKKEIVRVIL